MANGDIILEHRHIKHVKLIDAVSATDIGQWIDTADYANGSLEAVIATTATVQIYGSNAAAQPANATDGRQLGSDLLASQILDLTNAPRWIKAKVSAWTSGAVSVFVKLTRSSAS